MSAQRIADMKRMADKLADLAELEAPNFENVPGDVALRLFAESIRKTNASTPDNLPVN